MKFPGSNNKLPLYTKFPGSNNKLTLYMNVHSRNTIILVMKSRKNHTPKFDDAIFSHSLKLSNSLPGDALVVPAVPVVFKAPSSPVGVVGVPEPHSNSWVALHLSNTRVQLLGSGYVRVWGLPWVGFHYCSDLTLTCNNRSYYYWWKKNVIVQMVFLKFIPWDHLRVHSKSLCILVLVCRLMTWNGLYYSIITSTIREW